MRTGCAWRYLPADFPPWQTVYWHFKQWEHDKATEAVRAVLREQLRVYGFAVIPRRWTVEHGSPPTAHRRLARDDERKPATSEADYLGSRLPRKP